MSASRTLVLENLPPVVRITFENGVITLTAQNSESAPPSPSREARSQLAVPTQVSVQAPSDDLPFQIVGPGRYRLRNEEEVDLLPLPESQTAYEDGFRWYGIIPSESQEGWTTANQDSEDCDTWTPNGSWWGRASLQDPSDQDEWDVVAGPLPPPENSPSPQEEDDYPGPVPCVPPVVGHRFRMRNGEETEVDSQDDHVYYPFNGSTGESWTKTGYEFLDHTSSRDLVEDLGPVAPPVQEPTPASTVPPVVGHRFRMRNGKTVIVTKQDTDDWYPFDNCDAGEEPWKSLRIESDEKFARCWTAEGHHDLDESKQPYVSGYDLVEDLGSVIPRVPESTSSSAQEPFQIKEPGWYRFRNGTLVELRARTPNDRDRSRDHAYSWFAVNPVRDLTHSCQPVQTQGYDLANVLRYPWWRTDGSYVDLAGSSNLWCDVVSGPFPVSPVRTFPAWLHPNYAFVARDEDGTWYAYGKRPVKDLESDLWRPHEDDTYLLRLCTDQVAEYQRPSIVPDVPWYDSLIERPSVTS